MLFETNEGDGNIWNGIAADGSKLNFPNELGLDNVFAQRK